MQNKSLQTDIFLALTNRH